MTDTNLTPESVDIARMTEETGIAENDIYNALGVEKPLASMTLDELRSLRESRAHHDIKGEVVSLIKKKYREKLGVATSLEAIEALIDEFPDYLPSDLTAQAVNKLCKAARHWKNLRSVKRGWWDNESCRDKYLDTYARLGHESILRFNREGLLELYAQMPREVYERLSSEDKKRLNLMWEGVLKDAETYERLQDLVWKAVDRAPSKLILLLQEKIMEVVDNFNDLYYFLDISYLAGDNEETQRGYKRLFFEAISLAPNVEEIHGLTYIHRSPVKPNTVVGYYAVRRALQLSDSWDDMHRLWDFAHQFEENSHTRLRVIRKWLTFITEAEGGRSAFAYLLGKAGYGKEGGEVRAVWTSNIHAKMEEEGRSYIELVATTHPMHLPSEEIRHEAIRRLAEYYRADGAEVPV